MTAGVGMAPGEGSRPRVVVGVDGSPGARAALIAALTEAARRRAALEVVAAYRLDLYGFYGAWVAASQLEQIRADTGERAWDLVASVRNDPALADVPGVADVPVDLTLTAEPPAAALVGRSVGADLLVVGSRGRGAVRSALLGSVALHCVTHAQCPVLVVHDTAEQQRGMVLVGVDGSTASTAVLDAALDEAARRGAAVEVVAAFALTDHWSEIYTSVLPSVARVRGAVEQRTAELVAAVTTRRPAGATPEVRIEVVEGLPADVLVRRAVDAELLVVGSRSRSTLPGLLLGSVALSCAMRSPCPVLVVHPSVPVPGD